MAPRRRKGSIDVTGLLYRTARFSNDIGALFSGKPSRVARRGKNKLLGRVMARLNIWRLLWGK